MREETDAQLVARTRRGDLSAFGTIVDRHRATLVALAAGRLGSLTDAEDVAQEAFVQAFFRLHQLRKPEALLAWLRRLTDRLALISLRHRREEPWEPEQVEQARASRAQATDLSWATAGRGEAKKMLQELPVSMRQTVALTYLAGFTCPETASLLGIREGTVKSRLSRARAKLKEAFAMAEEELAKRRPKDEFTRETISRLMREARRLMEKGDLEAAGRRADKVLEMQAQQGFAAGGDPDDMSFDAEAARIAGLAYRERRRKDCEANAAQYGYRLEDLDWEMEDVDVLSSTLGRPAGKGNDVWGIPLSRHQIHMLDARDVCRRLHCSPLVLHQWVQRGLPALRCWPFVRFDWDRVRQWLKETAVNDWSKESDHDLDRPIRVILKAVYERKLAPEAALSIIDELDLP